MKLNYSVSNSTWTLTYYMIKSIGLAPFKLKEKIFYPPSFLDKLYPIVFATIYTLFMFIKVFLWNTSYEDSCISKLLFQINISYHVISFVTASCILATWVFKHEEIVYLMNKLCTFSDEFNNLGIEEDGEKIAKNIFAMSLIANIFSITICVILILTESSWDIYISIGHNIQEFIFLNVTLIFTNILFCVKQRFVLLNDKLYSEDENVRNVGLSHQDRIVVTVQTDGQNFYGFQRIRRIKTLHLELCDLVNRTTHIFAAPVLLLSSQFFTVLVISCYWIYFTFVDSSRSCAIHFRTITLSILCPLLRMLTVVIEMFVIAYASRKVCMQGNATQYFLHKLWNVVETTKSEYEFLMFSQQLLQNPLIISVFGFFDLDYSYLFRIFCAVLAYVIITIQLDAS